MEADQIFSGNKMRHIERSRWWESTIFRIERITTSRSTLYLRFWSWWKVQQAMRINEITCTQIITATGSRSISSSEGIRDAQQAIWHGRIRCVPSTLPLIDLTSRLERQTIRYREQINSLQCRSKEISCRSHQAKNGRDGIRCTPSLGHSRRS